MWIKTCVIKLATFELHFLHFLQYLLDLVWADWSKAIPSQKKEHHVTHSISLTPTDIKRINCITYAFPYMITEKNQRSSYDKGLTLEQNSFVALKTKIALIIAYSL